MALYIRDENNKLILVETTHVEKGTEITPIEIGPDSSDRIVSAISRVLTTGMSKFKFVTANFRRKCRIF